MLRTTIYFWLGLMIATIVLLIPLEYQARRRVNAANLPEKWRAFANSFHQWRMWQMYKDEAPSRGWPVWPYYVYIALFWESGFLFFSAFLMGKQVK